MKLVCPRIDVWDYFSVSSSYLSLTFPTFLGTFSNWSKKTLSKLLSLHKVAAIGREVRERVRGEVIKGGLVC